MKKIIISALLIGSFIAVQAQTSPQKPQEQPIYVKLLPSQLATLQQILQYSYQYLPKSPAPSNEVQAVLSGIQQLYPALTADTLKKSPTVIPVKKK